MRLSGSKTNNGTVNLALCKYAARHLPLQTFAALAGHGDYESHRQLRAEARQPYS